MHYPKVDQNHHKYKKMVYIHIGTNNRQNRNHLCIRNEKVRAFINCVRPGSCIYQDISMVMILMCGETFVLAGQTSTKAEYGGKPEKGKEVEYHQQT